MIYVHKILAQGNQQITKIILFQINIKSLLSVFKLCTSCHSYPSKNNFKGLAEKNRPPDANKPPGGRIFAALP